MWTSPGVGGPGEEVRWARKAAAEGDRAEALGDLAFEGRVVVVERSSFGRPQSGS